MAAMATARARYVLPFLVALVSVGMQTAHAACLYQDWLCTTPEVQGRPLRDAPTIKIQGTGGDGWFDGIYEATRHMPHDGSWMFKHERCAQCYNRYIYKSDWYEGYFIMSTDTFSGAIYGYAYAPDAEHPAEIPNDKWTGSLVGNMGVTSVAAGQTFSPTPLPPPPGPPILLSGGFVGGNNTVKPSSFTCPSGYTSSKRDAGGCSSYCGCDSGTCTFCCKLEAGYCYRQAPPSAEATEDHGYVKASCPKCEPSMANNNVCDPECNHPDCGTNSYDGGECCDHSGAISAEHPDICSDPAHVNYDASKNFRADFNAPRCRKPVRDQGSCGSCYAFAVSGAVSYQSCMAQLRKGSDIGKAYQLLSPQHIDSCNVGGSVKNGAGQCGGGYTGLTYAAIKDDEGFRPEDCYPYFYGGNPEEHFDADITAVTCEVSYNNNKPSCSGDNNYLVKAVGRGQQDAAQMRENYLVLNQENIEEIKRRLNTEGPLPFEYTVTEGFYNLDSSSAGPVGAGLYTEGTRDGNVMGGHAVMLIGYGSYTVFGQTTNYWVFENSWGLAPNHDQGVFYMDMNADWHAKLGRALVVVFDGEVVQGEGLEVEYSTVTAVSPATSRRRLQEAPESMEDVTRRRRASRRKLAEGDIMFAPISQVPEVDYLGPGAFVPVDCVSDEIATALEAAQTLIADNLGFNVSISGLYGCESQVSETRNQYIEVSVVDPDGKEHFYAFNISKTIAEYCDPPTVTESEQKLVDISTCKFPAEWEDYAKRLLEEYKLMDIDFKATFVNPARAKRDDKAAESQALTPPPTVGAGSATATALHVGLAMAAAAVAALMM